MILLIFTILLLGSTVHAEDHLPALTPMPREVDFGPRKLPTPAELAYQDAVGMGPRRIVWNPKLWLGDRVCPLHSWHLRRSRVFHLTTRDPPMVVATNRGPFRVEKGARFIVQKGASLAVIRSCQPLQR